MSKLQRAVLLVIVALVFVSGVLGVYALKSKPYPGANDFYSRWSGVQSFWLEGLDPYGEEASLAIQVGIYGRAVVEGEDPGFFAYPFYTVFLMAPLAFFEYAWAEAIWLTFLMALLIGALALLLDVFRWKPSPLQLGLTVLWTLLFYPSARGIMLGQVAILVYFLQVLAIWAVVKRRDALAGVALALSTVKPQMGFLIVPFLLLWALKTRRWRMVGGFGAAWGGLMALSFLLVPGWLGEWLAQVGHYTVYTDTGSPVWVVFHYYLPTLGGTGEISVSILLLLLMLWSWYRVILQHRDDEWGWTVALTLTVTQLVAYRTATPHHIVFFIPMFFYFKVLIDRDSRSGSRLIAMVQVTLLVSLWILFLVTIIGKQEQPINFVPLPVVLLLLLLSTRKAWTSRDLMRPPESVRVL